MSGTPAHVPYKIRLANGSEVPIPSATVLASLVSRGDIRADTVIFDAARGTWCRAGEATVVKFIVEEIGRDRPELLAHWSSDTTAQSKPQIPGPPIAPLTRMSAASGPVIRSASPAAPTAPEVPSAPSTSTSQQKHATSSPVAPKRPEAPPPAQASQGVNSGGAPREARADASGPGRTSTTKNLRRVFATSFVGAAAAVVGLGFLIRGRESRAEQVMGPVRTLGVSNASYPLVQLPENELSRIGFAADTGISSQGEPAPLPVFRRPKVPLLTDAQIITDLDVSNLVEDAAVDLPAPPRPEHPSGAEPAYDVAPQARNANQVRQALEREYPIGLRETGIGGRVEMTFFIDERGGVERFEVTESSGNQALDQAALRVAQVFQFTPARRRNQSVPASLTLGITFDSRNVGAAASTAPSSAPAQAPAPVTPSGVDQPEVTPFDAAPQVRNANQVRQALAREYPIGLRDAGIGGRVEMWFYVNAQGIVEQFQVKQSSGNAALDRAALRVAQVFQFTPALLADEPVEAWVSLGITFEGK